MNTVKWVILLLSAHVLIGCASDGPDVEGLDTFPRLSSTPATVSKPKKPQSSSVDADKDGIADTMDDCLGSTANSLVDVSGCELVFGVIEGLKFEPNETKLSVESRLILSRIVDVIRRYPEVTLSVAAHTDNRGSASANLELSKQRVLSVVRYLVTNGIDPNKILPYGYGESRPRAANATAIGREQNRRVEINVVDPLL